MTQQNHWIRKRLGEFCSILIGGTPARNKPDYWDITGNSGNLWASIKDLTQRVVNDTLEKITNAGVRYSNAKLIRKGSILMSFKLTIGRVAFAGRDLYTNEAIAAFNSDEVDLEYLYYGLQHWNLLADVDQAVKGATLNKAKIRQIEAYLPASRFEQAKIVEILSPIDRAIEDTEALIVKYQRMKTASMQDLLTRGVDESGRPRDFTTHKFKSSILGLIPEEWEVKLLEEVAEIGTGLTLGRTIEGENVIEVPYLRVANVQDGYLDLSDVKTVRVYKHEIDRYLLRPGDVLMNEGGDYDKLGRGTVWGGQISLCLHQNHVFRVRTDQEKLLPEFLALISASPYGKEFFILSSKQSTNLASINSTQLKRFPITCPVILEQRRIVDEIKACDTKIQSEISTRHKLEKIKTGLMQDLLTGKVSVAPLLEAKEGITD